MKQPIQALPLNWCNNDVVLTSVMEAVSFVTPVLEHFFIRTVSAAQFLPAASSLTDSCQTFIREEANHAQAHQKLNARLLPRLGKYPPGLAMVGSLLELAKRHLNLEKRLALAAALEHFAAVFSKLYIHRANALQFSHAQAQQLFAMHAQEELGHRSVVFDLWLATAPHGQFKRAVTLIFVVLLGSCYLALTVPWIVHCKTERKFLNSAALLLKFVGRNLQKTLSGLPISELLSFARRDYHPEHLLD